MTTTYKGTPLFGGALVCDLPENFADVSTIRQVPDNQEVYIDKDGFTSIIFDIMERVGGKGRGPEIDGPALTTHLEELVGEDIDRVKVWNSTETQFSRLDDNIPCYSIIATQSPPPPAAEERSAPAKTPDFTAIILTLVRLERENTDMLITINVPHIRGEYDEDDVNLELGNQGRLIGDAVNHAAKIWETFKVKDWNLFNEV